MVTEQIALLPCPFCEGPPVPIVQKDFKGGYCEPIADYGDGRDVSAMVFCHECGCEGPRYETRIYGIADYREAEAEAVRLWQSRDGKHRAMFDGGEARGLNLYPRGDA